MRDALRDEMIKKICVRDTDNILDVGCGDGTFLHELTRWKDVEGYGICLLYTSPSPRDGLLSRMPSSA